MILFGGRAKARVQKVKSGVSANLRGREKQKKSVVEREREQAWEKNVSGELYSD